MIDIFINNILPVFLIAAVGFIAAGRFDLQPGPFGKLLFYVFSPSLVFYSLATSTIDTQELVQLLFVMLVVTGLILFVAWVAARAFRFSTIQQSGILLGAMWPNDGNLGLPIVKFAFGDEVLARAVIIYVIVSLFAYSIGVVVASRGTHSWQGAMIRVLQMPVFYAALLGIMVNVLRIPLFPTIDRSISLLSQATIPVMLIMLGIQFAQSASFTKMRPALMTISLRLLISPAIALTLGVLFGLRAEASIALVMQMAMPVAVATIIFAEEFTLDRQQVLSTVFLSTLLSPLTLSILIAMLKVQT